MRDLMRYANECLEMLDAIHIPYGNVVDWKINTRAKSRWGLCKRTGSLFKIEISDRLLSEECDENGLINTILHELLHTVPGCFNHGSTWKEMARRVYKEYGIEIKREESAEEKGVAEIVMEKQYKYFLRCPDCGYVFKYMRMVNAVKTPERYRHPGCIHNLERIYEI